MLPKKSLYQKDNAEKFNVKCTITDGRYVNTYISTLLNSK